MHFNNIDCLAQHARHTALLLTLRARPDLDLEQLDYLSTRGRYADDLRVIRIREILALPSAPSPALAIHDGETLEDAVLRVFRQIPGRELTSGYFVRWMGLERWTAQGLLADMAERGVLVRSGRTSGTRYKLAEPASQVRPELV